MPTYDYACARCGEMEVFQSIRDDALRACPECGSADFRKLVSVGAGVIFKGDGFYTTDYERGSGSAYRKQAESESRSADKADKTASTAGGDGGCGSGCACAPGQDD